MKDLKEYVIPFVGLKVGEHHYDFKIDKSFFEHFEYDDFSDANIDLDVTLTKKTTLLEFDLEFKGSINVLCDITSEPFDQQISGDFSFVVKFGDEFNDENEELLILPHGSHEVAIQQYAYESIVLAVPAKRVHPAVLDGSMKSEILDKLEELKPNVDRFTKDDNNTDPRWDELKKLLTDK